MYLLEGNIGVGKSTFLKLVKEQVPGLNVVGEPVDKWEEQNSKQSILENFYTKPTRWAYTMEGYTAACRVRNLMNNPPSSTSLEIFERSVYSGHYCFAKNSYLTGLMDKLEWKIYEEWFDFLVAPLKNKPKGFIYLKVDPKTALSRVLKRGRSSEETVTQEYINQIHQRHEDFLVEKTDILPAIKDVPVLTLDCNSDFEDQQFSMDRHIEKLVDFVASTS